MGNVGQLAADLLVSTLEMVRVGHFHTECLIPMVGNNPYSSSEEHSALLSTNAEGQISLTQYTHLLHLSPLHTAKHDYLHYLGHYINIYSERYAR